MRTLPESIINLTALETLYIRGCDLLATPATKTLLRKFTTTPNGRGIRGFSDFLLSSEEENSISSGVSYDSLEVSNSSSSSYETGNNGTLNDDDDEEESSD